MPTLDISLKDLNKLSKLNLSFAEVEERAILYVKGEIDGHDGDDLKVDCKETNRPDLWSTEGIARELRAKYGKEKGIPKYKVNVSKVVVNIESSVNKVRPYIAAAIVKDVKVDNDLIIQMIQLQEKVSMTFGRKRKEVAMGLYDLDKITPPIRYIGADPDKVKFKPLESEREMSLRQILARHPKGIEYGHLIKDSDKYPLVIDSKNVVASMPPIINSDITGKVTEKTKNLFIEVTGFNQDILNTALNVIVMALADRGGKVESVKIKYDKKTLTSPSFEDKKINVDLDYLKRISGLNLKDKEIISLAEKSRFNAKIKKNILEVEYPGYRQDILHPIDIIEDLIISYGYDKIEPEIPKLATIGELDKFEVYCEKVRSLLPGVGAQELLNFTLTNKGILFDKMNLDEMGVVEIANPVSNLWSVLRNWMIPSLMEFFSKNKNQEYPQQVYEVGDVVVLDDEAETKTKTIKRLAWALISKDANFTKAKQVLDFVLRSLNVEYKMIEVEHSSFISGRVARVIVDGQKVAYIGEIHPQVLINFGLDMPVIAFELNLSDLYGV